MAQDLLSVGRKSHWCKTQMNAWAAQRSPCEVAACRAVLAKHWRRSLRTWMVTQGRMQIRASRHGVMAKAGKSGKARQCGPGTAAQAGRHVKLAGLWSGPCGSGGSAVVPAAPKMGSDLPYCLPQTYHLCLSLSIPTPLICKNKFSPTSIFLYFFLFISFYNSSP